MGKATVQLLRRDKFKVYVLDVKETKDAAYIPCDVSRYEHIRQAVRQVLEKEGSISGLFVAAGIHLFATIEQTILDEFERVLAINLKGTFYVLKEVLPIMRQQQYGSIVLMGSDQVHVGKGSSSVYGLSKAAIGQLTKSTAIDYAQYNVRVNCICPGTIDTPMLPPTIERFHASSGIPVADIYEMLKKAQPVQRMGTPQGIASVVRFLLSDECSFMTGALINVDGGYTCQ
jgi:NAD(P)-dependent dehydrogenase (short-subunit alcohol dehydrogenase family)